jgi:hypothetical protein
MSRTVPAGWNTAPPATTAPLVGEPQTSKVNRLAVLPPRMLTTVEADSVTDTETVFLMDDKDRFQTGITFNDGDAFMYFVVARDLLGRGDAPSNGRGVRVKDRMPTNPPVKVRVRSAAHYNGTTRELTVGDRNAATARLNHICTNAPERHGDVLHTLWRRDSRPLIDGGRVLQRLSHAGPKHPPAVPAGHE